MSSNLPLPPSTSSSSISGSVSKNQQSDNEVDSASAQNEQYKDVSTQDIYNYGDKTEVCSPGVATQTVQLEDEDQKSPKDEDPITTENEEAEVEQTQSESVRVRTDLNDVTVAPTDNEEQYLNGDVSQISGIIINALRVHTPPVSSAASDNGFMYDQPKEIETKLNKEENCTDGKEKSDCANRFIDLDSSETVNIIEIDGIHILVPSEFLEKSAAMLENTEEPETDVNIQTDEVMPPRGELSEQESISGNDSSMWVQVCIII
jgi:hypothetical protein